MRVIRYLSLEWIEALSNEVSSTGALDELAHEHTIGVTQVITDGPEGMVVYHLQVGDGAATFGTGAAYPEDVRMEQDWQTAVAVATDSLSAQEAFLRGKVRISGNQQKLLESQPVFGALNQVFLAVRERTDYR
jgi:hypothetical protein